MKNIVEKLFNTTEDPRTESKLLTVGDLVKYENIRTASVNDSFDPLTGIVYLDTNYRYLGDVTQNALINFIVPDLPRVAGSTAFIRITANGSGILFTNMIEHSGSAGVDLIPGTVNLISFIYTGGGVYYSVQQEVASNPDVVAPTVSAASIEIGLPNEVVVVFTEKLDPAAIPGLADFDIIDTTGLPAHPVITAVDVLDDTVTITTSTTLVAGHVYQLTYTQAVLQDLSGNKVTSFSGQSITNYLAIYSPTAYSAFTKIMWAKAREKDGILSDGATLTSLTNLGTKGGNYANIGAAPTFAVNQLNGTGVGRFLGSSTQYLRTASAHTRNNIYTKFIVFKATTGSSGSIDIQYSLFDQVDFGSAANKIRNYCGTGRTSDPQAVTSGTYGNTWVILTIIAGATNAIRRINGAVDLTTAQTVTPTTSASNHHWIGYGGVGSPATMDWAEQIIVEGEMAQADVEKFEGYLAWTLGLQSSLDAGHPYKSNPPAA